MPRLRFPLFFLALLFLPLTAFAASADLEIAVRIVGAPHTSKPVQLAIVVTNHGPDRATGIELTSPASTDPLDDRNDSRCRRLSGDPAFRCVAPSLEPGESTTFSTATGIFFEPRHAIFFFDVRADQDDPNRGNNHAVLELDHVTPSSLGVTLTLPPSMDQDRIGTLRITVENRSVWDVTDARVLLGVTQLAKLVRTDPAMPCTQTPDRFSPFPRQLLDCAVPVIPAKATRELAFEVQFEREAFVDAFVNLKWGSISFNDAKATTYYVPFVVTHTGDAGGGSLRQAILDSNVVCTDPQRACRIIFDIAGDDRTIRPLSPLPEIRALWMTIDDPAVKLDGSAAGNADGLLIRSRRAEVVGLTITHFAGQGIHVDSAETLAPSYRIAHNVIRENGRGVLVANGDLQLEDNVLSDNVRSGAFLTCRSVAVLRNYLTGNGASGVFINRGRGSGRADVADNVIERNHEFGIAIVPDSVIVIGKNFIAHNGFGGIDLGLDGPTIDVPAGRFAAIPSPPRVESARFDGQKTVIEGTTIDGGSQPGGASSAFAVDFYANGADDPEGERFLGTAKVVNRRFRFEIDGDLRGQWITSIAQQLTSYFGGEYTEVASSEFSRAVVVE